MTTKALPQILSGALLREVLARLVWELEAEEMAMQNSGEAF
jgi:hypothetical protein